jgi:antitoxin ChpS
MSRKLPYKLSDLTAQCDPDAPVPQDMIDWEKAAPVGLEQFAEESKEFSIGLSVRQGKPDRGHS